MKIHFLGTCAGTEPMPERHHTAFVVECGGNFYWFDAGEGCSRTAHNMGLDLLKIRKVIISHPHIDHTGGLSNLLWTIQKLIWRKSISNAGDVDIYLPNLNIWDTVMRFLQLSDDGFKTDFLLCAHTIEDGVLFDDGFVRVSALHNTHIQPCDGLWQSYSFLIEGNGKRLVYSGDVRNYEELDPLLTQKCDGLIIETGHFGIEDVYSYTKNKSIGKLFFNHNGREILNHPEKSAEKITQFFGNRAIIAYDKMTVEL